MLSNEQLESLVTGLQSSAMLSTTEPEIDPEWIRDARSDYEGRVNNFLENVMVDQVTSGTPGLGGSRDKDAVSAIFGISRLEICQAASRYLASESDSERALIAESCSANWKVKIDRRNKLLNPNTDSRIIAGDSRFYRIDDGLVVALQRDLAGSMPWVEFGSKVNGCRTIRFLGLGESLANAWAHVYQFGQYLLNSKKSQKADNASASKEQSADAFSKKVETFLASVPVDKRYEVIHRKGSSFLKSLQLLGL